MRVAQTDSKTPSNRLLTDQLSQMLQMKNISIGQKPSQNIKHLSESSSTSPSKLMKQKLQQMQREMVINNSIQGSMTDLILTKKKLSGGQYNSQQSGQTNLRDQGSAQAKERVIICNVSPDHLLLNKERDYIKQHEKLFKLKMPEKLNQDSDKKHRESQIIDNQLFLNISQKNSPSPQLSKLKSGSVKHSPSPTTIKSFNRQQSTIKNHSQKNQINSKVNHTNNEDQKKNQRKTLASPQKYHQVGFSGNNHQQQKSASRVKFSSNILEYQEDEEGNVKETQKIQASVVEERDQLFLDTPIFGYAPLVYKENTSGWNRIQNSICSPFRQDFKKLLQYVETMQEMTTSINKDEIEASIKKLTSNFPFYYIKLKEDQYHAITQQQELRNQRIKKNQKNANKNQNIRLVQAMVYKDNYLIDYQGMSMMGPHPQNNQSFLKSNNLSKFRKLSGSVLDQRSSQNEIKFNHNQISQRQSKNSIVNIQEIDNDDGTPVHRLHKKAAGILQSRRMSEVVSTKNGQHQHFKKNHENTATTSIKKWDLLNQNFNLARVNELNINYEASTSINKIINTGNFTANNQKNTSFSNDLQEYQKVKLTVKKDSFSQAADALIHGNEDIVEFASESTQKNANQKPSKNNLNPFKQSTKSRVSGKLNQFEDHSFLSQSALISEESLTSDNLRIHINSMNLLESDKQFRKNQRLIL
eukprot:403336659